MQSLLILGRQPELGLAELESLYGSERILPITKHAAIVDVDPCLLAFKRLGGSIKFAKLLTILGTTNWQDIEDFLVNSAPEHSKNMPSGKMTFGISLYDFDIDIRTITESALNIKRAIQKTNRSVRIVPNKLPALNTAQVIHNKLTNERSWELLIIKSGNQTYVAQTVMVQDIEAYSKRDQARPYRDSKVGMLPPKLAQIIINLAVGKLEDSELKSICDIADRNPGIIKLNGTILDPFSGSGVILQEAYLMGYNIIGSDINLKMVENTKKNLSWLAAQHKSNTAIDNVSVGDARNIHLPNFDHIATETYLGKPLKLSPSKSELKDTIAEINSLIEQFLINIASQTKPGVRLCLAVPAWPIAKDQFTPLPIIDHLTDLGYNLIDFKHIGKQLVYHRPNQIVARQLLTLVRE